ncbi:MAG: acyl-CoA dehydratase activase [Bacillota bacterium]|nr:acyl-CoA dehydratase activase [Bacillota bacterium]
MAEGKERNIRTFLGLDVGVFAVKGVLINDGKIEKAVVLTAGKPVESAFNCIRKLVNETLRSDIQVGLTGYYAKLVAGSLGLKRIVEIEALKAGIEYLDLDPDYVLSLGHENIYYLEIDRSGKLTYFNRNGQCAAGSGSFWYQQATRMGYNDRELAELAVQSDIAVPISGRCAVFAKSDMTHSINEGATLGAVSAGMAQALVENALTSVARNRIKGPGSLVAVGGVADNQAVIKYLKKFTKSSGLKLVLPDEHVYINAIGASLNGNLISATKLLSRIPGNDAFNPEIPLSPLNPALAIYLNHKVNIRQYDLSKVYLGVDCGSVSTKGMLIDYAGRDIGGVYLPTSGRPALQVLKLIRLLEEKYGNLIKDSQIIVCTTGSGRFLSQKILNAEYAVDEITCQAEGVKSHFSDEDTLSIIEIGGEDSKFIQLENGILSDYSMNPVCAAGTGTFLENLAELLGINIKNEFSDNAFKAEYGVDLGDICTLISQSILASASARGLPLNEQLASLAYSSARNYLSKTVDRRPLKGKIIFTGATAKNHALASALAAILEKKVIIPAEPELTGALGSALMARKLDSAGIKGVNNFRGLSETRHFSNEKMECKADCKDEHNCVLNVINFCDDSKFIYGDRCGRYSGINKKTSMNDFPEYEKRRLEMMESVAPLDNNSGPTVGIARCGLYYEYYPFWAAFFNRVGCKIISSEHSSEKILHQGKSALDSEMCYPMKVIVGHYRELSDKKPDYIFIPEVVDMEPPEWALEWPRSFVCPLLQTLRGTIMNSLSILPEKALYARLNFRSGNECIKEQMKNLTEKILGDSFNENIHGEAVREGFEALNSFRKKIADEGKNILHDLINRKKDVNALVLSRSYTLYDRFISKQFLTYARQSGINAIPYEHIFYFLQSWIRGETWSPQFDLLREEFKKFMQEEVSKIENIYPAQLQKILSTVLLVNFLNERRLITGLPKIYLIFVDPFKCGPNAMLRHYLSDLTNYLRLTLDEHTAAAGMITRLEAFKNTSQGKEEIEQKRVISSRTTKISEKGWKKILIPGPTRHSEVFAALFRRYGLDAEVLPAGDYGDISLAQRSVNGEECLPFIQNLQDFFSYLKKNGDKPENGEVFFQGWACGPCRYGLYAPTQALVLNRSGYGEARVCAVKFSDIYKRFGFGFVITLYNALVTIDILYRLLYSIRPYEKKSGQAEEIFSRYADRVEAYLVKSNSSRTSIKNRIHRRDFEKLLADAASEFNKVVRRKRDKPKILLGGEFYVRFDQRCNQKVIEKIEQSGGEVLLAPMTELFTYTILIDSLEAAESFQRNHKISTYARSVLYRLLLNIAQNNEAALESAAGYLIGNLNEPTALQIMRKASRYVSSHYGGEPPMTLGRVAALAGKERVAGAIFVAPFTCMPGSIVEAQQRLLQKDTGIPVTTIYYDGKDNTSRDELVEGLVYQARQLVDSSDNQPVS